MCIHKCWLWSMCTGLTELNFKFTSHFTTQTHSPLCDVGNSLNPIYCCFALLCLLIPCDCLKHKLNFLLSNDRISVFMIITINVAFVWLWWLHKTKFRNFIILISVVVVVVVVTLLILILRIFACTILCCLHSNL